MKNACSNHPGKSGLYRCETCKRYFCEECVKSVHYSDEAAFRVCLKCGGKCVNFKQEEADRLEKQAFAVSFWTELPKIFIYPFLKGGGWIILWLGAYFGYLSYNLVACLRMQTVFCCPVVRNVLSAPLGLFFALSLVSLYGLLTYAQGLVFATAGGGDEPADWNSINFFGRLFSAGTGLSAVLVAVFLGLPLQYLVVYGAGHPAILAAFGAGLLLFPVLFVRLALKEDAQAFHLAGIARDVGVFAWEYVVSLAGFLGICWALYKIVLFGFYGFDAATAANIQYALMPFAVYLLMVMMRLLGLYGRAIEGRYAWIS